MDSDSPNSPTPVKIHKVTLLVVDHDQLGADRLQEVIEAARYPNRGCSPIVISIQSAEVGWTDAHPLNGRATMDAAFRDLFAAAPTAWPNPAEFECKGCRNVPGSDGVLVNGKGCFEVSADGGGSEYAFVPPSAEPEIAWSDADGLDDSFVTARIGPLGIEIINLAEGGWAWSVMIGGVPQARGGGAYTTLAAAKSAAIAAARAWLDSIRL